MIDVITAIALLCQVSAGTGVGSHSHVLSATHRKQKQCHKKLVLCFHGREEKLIDPVGVLSECIAKGDY